MEDFETIDSFEIERYKEAMACFSQVAKSGRTSKFEKDEIPESLDSGIGSLPANVSKQSCRILLIDTSVCAVSTEFLECFVYTLETLDLLSDSERTIAKLRNELNRWHCEQLRGKSHHKRPWLSSKRFAPDVPTTNFTFTIKLPTRTLEFIVTPPLGDQNYSAPYHIKQVCIKEQITAVFHVCCSCNGKGDDLIKLLDLPWQNDFELEPFPTEELKKKIFKTHIAKYFERFLSNIDSIKPITLAAEDIEIKERLKKVSISGCELFALSITKKEMSLSAEKRGELRRELDFISSCFADISTYFDFRVDYFANEISKLEEKWSSDNSHTLKLIALDEVTKSYKSRVNTLIENVAKKYQLKLTAKEVAETLTSMEQLKYLSKLLEGKNPFEFAEETEKSPLNI